MDLLGSLVIIGVALLAAVAVGGVAARLFVGATRSSRQESSEPERRDDGV